MQNKSLIPRISETQAEALLIARAKNQSINVNLTMNWEDLYKYTVSQFRKSVCKTVILFIRIGLILAVGIYILTLINH